MVNKKFIYTCRNFILLLLVLFFSSSFAQNDLLKRDKYQIGPDEKLLITVHIFGEVKKPGEYMVSDNTNLLELISKAGGPTEFANLSDLKITRGLIGYADYKKALKKQTAKKSNKLKSLRKQVVKVNLKKMLDKEKYRMLLPTLQPGDVVRVGKNAWFTWQTIIRIISQLAIIAQVWYWYNRVDNGY